jgi:hypothetical protein
MNREQTTVRHTLPRHAAPYSEAVDRVRARHAAAGCCCVGKRRRRVVASQFAIAA